MAKLALSGAFRLQPFDASEDPDVAPGAFSGPDPAPPWTLARARQNMLWIYLLGLVFLGFSVASLVLSDPTAGQWAYAIAVLVAIAVGYALAAWMCDASLSWRWAYLGLFVLLVVATYPFLGWGVVYYGIYVCILFSTLIPWRHARWGILVTAVTVMVLAVVTEQWVALSIGLSGLLVGWATGAAIETGRVSNQLASTRHRVAVLSVAAERERIGRDLHDILGHSLTAISIKAGLAARLVDQDATAARSEIGDIEDIARQALDDVRATASGYREVSLATEVASARSVLLAAGIEARTPSAVEPATRTVSELFGYVVREAVTNVVRHSEATTCTVELARDSVTITDDGRGSATAAPAGGSARAGGSGLSGLAARLDAAGGRFSVRSQPGRGTVVRAELLTSSTAQVVTPAELGSR